MKILKSLVLISVLGWLDDEASALKIVSHSSIRDIENLSEKKEEKKKEEKKEEKKVDASCGTPLAKEEEKKEEKKEAKIEEKKEDKKENKEQKKEEKKDEKPYFVPKDASGKPVCKITGPITLPPGTDTSKGPVALVPDV